MKIVATHTSPDWDAITSVWLVKRYLPGWEDATVSFVPAGGRLFKLEGEDVIETSKKGEEVIHVDTGLGKLDHHQTSEKTVCGASLTWDYVKDKATQGKTWDVHSQAVSRIVAVVVELDHFREIFWPETDADYQEFGLFGLLEGLKAQYPEQDEIFMTKGMEMLDALVHNFENRIWAEREIKAKGQEFMTRFGKALAVETINGAVVKLAQKMGYMIVVRKDPRKGNIQIKARPQKEEEEQIDLTHIYMKLEKMDPEATWYLHISKKMLLNGSMKNPTMVPSELTLEQVKKVVEGI